MICLPLQKQRVLCKNKGHAFGGDAEDEDKVIIDTLLL
jgi:hypothetical protein